MPPGRLNRMGGVRRQRPASTAQTSHQPRIDAFGTLRLPAGNHERGRLMEYMPDRYAFFPADQSLEPCTFETNGEFKVNGRVFKTTLNHDGSEISFQRAGCGCETPQHLRGSRRPLLERLPAEEPPEAP